MKTRPSFALLFLLLLLCFLSAPSTLRAAGNAAPQGVDRGSNPGLSGMQLGSDDVPNRIPIGPQFGGNLGSRYEILPTGGAGTGTYFGDPTLNGPSPIAVPEPASSWLLLALGIIPLLKMRNSRKTSAL